MNLESFFTLFFTLIKNIILTLGNYSIEAFGVSVPLTVLIGAIIIFGMVVNVFWRGAKG